jgi:hypothetical protein
MYISIAGAFPVKRPGTGDFFFAARAPAEAAQGRLVDLRPPVPAESRGRQRSNLFGTCNLR